MARRKFDKFWAQEEVWIRKGIEARRTRNEGRVRRLETLRVEREQRRERAGRIKVEVDAGERSGKLVCEMIGVSKSLGGQPLIRDLDLTIMRGDRVGLIGPNGAGKSTLLRLILGELEPGRGHHPPRHEPERRLLRPAARAARRRAERRRDGQPRLGLRRDQRRRGATS